MMDRPSHDQLRRFQELERVIVSTASVTATYEDDITYINTGGAPKTVSLKPPRNGLRVTIVKKGGSTVTVSVSGGALINGALTSVIAADYTPLRLKDINGEYISV